MIVNAYSDIISLNIAPEDYIIEYSLEALDDPVTCSLKLSSLLTFKPKKDKFISSVPDFIWHRERLGINFNLTPKCFEVCKAYISQVSELQAIKDGSINDKIVTDLKTEPFQDQKAAIAFMLSRKKALNSSSVGVGKSLTALGCFNILRNQNRIGAGIIFCLNENKLSWRGELEKHTNYKFKIVGNGTSTVLKDIDSFNEDLLVVHYDALLNSEVCVAIIQQHFHFMIIDEAHILRNGDKKKKGKNGKFEPSCKRASSIYELAATSKSSYIIALTGTPISQSPLNAYGILKLLKPNFVPERTKFENCFCNFIQIPYRRGSPYKIKILNKTKPYKNLDELKSLLELVSYRRTHEQVTDFPKTMYNPKKLEMEKDQQILYNRIKDETFREIASHPEKALNLDKVIIKTLRLRQCLSNPVLIGEKNTSSIKLKVLDQLLEEILGDDNSKVVVYSPYRPTLDLLYNKYKETYKAGLFAGVSESLSSEDRDFNVTSFISGDSRLLVANTSKAIGQNWKVARTAIFLDLPIISIDFIQSCGRLQRRDGVGTTIIMPLLVENSMDEFLWKRLDDMRKDSNQVISRDSEIVINKEELLRVLK